MEKENQRFEQYSKALPSKSDHDEFHNRKKGQEQESSYDFPSSLHPSATPTRAQQQKHRRNLRLNGQVDVEKGSLPRHTYKDDRRDSWIDRINSSTKNVIRRTSVVATTMDEKKWIDKVADSINEYGDQHKDDSWTDKVMDFLFPSMGLNSSSASSDIKKTTEPLDHRKQLATPPSSDNFNQKKQHQDDHFSGSTNTTGIMSKLDKIALNKHPDGIMKSENSDQAYGDTPDKQTNRISYADVTQHGRKRSTSSSSSTSSWSLFNENSHEEQKLDLNNESQWPPL